jgi:hypothetical protein
MLREKYGKKSESLTRIACAVFILTFCALGVIWLSATAPMAASDSSSAVQAASDAKSEQMAWPAVTMEVRVDRIEQMLPAIQETLKSIKETGERAEIRSYENKMMARELIRFVEVMVGALVVIALGFPLAIWLMSKKRLLGLSELSQEVSATLLVVEERQAKLANILKDIQSEIDYVHGMSVPDLKNLIKQAEKYLEQNQKDLAKTGRGKQEPQH